MTDTKTIEGNNCYNHKKDIAGIADMTLLAEMIGDLHYESLANLFKHLARKIDLDAEKDNIAGREKIASALQYAGFSIFESALRLEKVWKISKPFMEDKNQNNG